VALQPVPGYLILISIRREDKGAATTKDLWYPTVMHLSWFHELMGFSRAVVS
jgi:hypothetical protein